MRSRGRGRGPRAAGGSGAGLVVAGQAQVAPYEGLGVGAPAVEGPLARQLPGTAQQRATRISDSDQRLG